MALVRISRITYGCFNSHAISNNNSSGRGQRPIQEALQVTNLKEFKGRCTTINNIAISSGMLFEWGIKLLASYGSTKLFTDATFS